MQIHAGPRLLNHLKFAPAPAKSMNVEYSGLECAVEVVDDVAEAMTHIHKYGSSHTDVIITEDGKLLSLSPLCFKDESGLDSDHGFLVFLTLLMFPCCR